jgi:hypothetical protein
VSGNIDSYLKLSSGSSALVSGNIDVSISKESLVLSKDLVIIDSGGKVKYPLPFNINRRNN